MTHSGKVKELRPLPGQCLMALPQWTHYLIAFALTIGVLLARLSFGQAEGTPATLILFVIPILFSSYVGGLGPGLLASLTAFLTSNYYLLPPFGSFAIHDVRHQIQWVALLAVGVLVSVLVEALRRDRTMLMEKIAALNHAEKMRQDVERIIRHDIKSPLNSLYSVASLAADGTMDSGICELLPQLMHSIRNIINLIDSSEKVLLMEQGGYSPQAKWFDLRECMCSIELSLKTLCAARQVRLVWALPAGQDKAPAYGEEFLIEDMLMNLIKNAVEASPTGGAVTVTPRIGSKATGLAIHNLGTVPECLRDRFFEKYATSGKSYGTGLGTYSAELIAKAHGGSIEFETSEAEGTSVTVILPCPEDRWQRTT